MGARRRRSYAATARLSAEGFDDLRPAYSPVFQHMERRGTRIGVLAERARMTNQSMGYLVDALERRGYVERRPDPADRRAAVVVITDRGRVRSPPRGG